MDAETENQLIEAVARALADDEPDEIFIEKSGWPRPRWVLFIGRARAVISAINASRIAWLAPWEAPMPSKPNEPPSPYDVLRCHPDPGYLWQTVRDAYLDESA